MLKTIGFTSRSVLALILAESVLLLGLGGAAALALADLVVRVVLAKLGPTVPLLPVGLEIWLEGVGLMLAIGLLWQSLARARASSAPAQGRGVAGAARPAAAHRRCVRGSLSAP